MPSPTLTTVSWQLHRLVNEMWPALSDKSALYHWTACNDGASTGDASSTAGETSPDTAAQNYDGAPVVCFPSEFINACHLPNSSASLKIDLIPFLRKNFYGWAYL